MEVRIAPSWKNLLSGEFEKDYFQKLTDFVRKEYTEHICYPKGKDIFLAFDACPFENLKVVLVNAEGGLKLDELPEDISRTEKGYKYQVKFQQDGKNLYAIINAQLVK